MPRTGAQWRSLTSDFGPRQTVYPYFRKWGGEGVFEQLSALLVGEARGRLADKVMERLGARLEVTKQPKLPGRDFVPAGRRWVVERAFARMENFRRLTIDYESRSDSTVAMIYLANCCIALNKLLKHAP